MPRFKDMAKKHGSDAGELQPLVHTVWRAFKVVGVRGAGLL